MKKAQLKIRFTLVFLFLVAVTMASCYSKPEVPTEVVATSQTEATALQEAKNTFETDWEAYLAFSETVNSRMLWAMDYAEAVANDSTWENLLKARAACGAAKLEFQLLQLPEITLTDAQYSLLMDAGIEADVLLMVYESLPLLRSSHLNTITLLENIETNDIFFSAVADAFPGWIEDQKKLIKLDNEYLCITTNYLLLQLEYDSLWDTLKEKYPVIASGCGEWITDPEQLMQNCDSVLAQTAQMELALAEYIGIWDYTAGIVREAVSTADLERLAAQMKEISGVPAYFPAPGWMPEEFTQYYLIAYGHSKENRLVEPGEEILQAPSACYISCGNISREAVEYYAESLKACGLEPYSQWNEEAQSYQMLVSSGSCQLMVQWTQEETVIYMNDPVGCLIPELYLRAKDAK